MPNRIYLRIFAGLFSFLTVTVSGVAVATVDRNTQNNTLVVADFESKEAKNNIDGGYFGVWQKDGDKSNRGCRMSFFEPGRHYSLYCLKLEYDVSSSKSGSAVFYLLFADRDLSSYRKISFWAKGDNKAGYTRTFMIEFKNDNEAGSVIIPPISDEWRRIDIPLSKFNIKDWTDMTEFDIVFEESVISKKKGTIYIDDIILEK